MIINPDAPSGYTILCDDIRHEITGKTTLVGVYNTQLIVTGEAPVTLPQICMVINLRLHPPKDAIAPTIKIFRSDQVEPIYEMTAELEPEVTQAVPMPTPTDPDSVTFLQLGFNAIIPSLVIDGPFSLKVRAFLNGDEVRLGALQIAMVQPNEEAE